jgi:hypothetical protein
VILLGSNGQNDRAYFQSVTAEGTVDNPWSREDEHFTTWVCRGFDWNLSTVWPGIKKWG